MTSKPCSTAHLQAAEEDVARSGEPCAEHANADDVALRGERAHDTRAGRAVPAEIALRVLLDDSLPVGVQRDGHGSAHLADELVTGIDATVENADAHALARRVSPRPLPRDLDRPFDGKNDPVGGLSGRETPGWPKVLRHRP